MQSEIHIFHRLISNGVRQTNNASCLAGNGIYFQNAESMYIMYLKPTHSWKFNLNCDIYFSPYPLVYIRRPRIYKTSCFLVFQPKSGFVADGLSVLDHLVIQFFDNKCVIPWSDCLVQLKTTPWNSFWWKNGRFYIFINSLNI